MRFRDFIKNEEASGTDRGLMGIPKASSVRKPSDGQLFKNNGPAAGQEPRGGGSAGTAMPGSMPMFMRKRMKK